MFGMFGMFGMWFHASKFVLVCVMRFGVFVCVCVCVCVCVVWVFGGVCCALL